MPKHWSKLQKRDIQAYRQQDRDSDTLQCLQNG